MGYALNWPDAVQGLALEAPAGLEEYPAKSRSVPARNCAAVRSESFGRDFDKWVQSGTRPAFWPRKSPAPEQNIRDFFYFKKRDPVTGVVSRVPSGYFMNRQPICQRSHTEQRVGLTKGNPKELEQWATSSFSTSMAWWRSCRGRSEKPLRRLTQIKAPIFLAFGDKEPFIPGTSLNGLKDLAARYHHSLYERMAIAGNRPILKIYPDTGSLHSHGQSGGIRGRCRRLREQGQRRHQLAARHRPSCQWPVQWLPSALPVAPTPPGASPTAGLNK